MNGNAGGNGSFNGVVAAGGSSGIGAHISYHIIITVTVRQQVNQVIIGAVEIHQALGEVLDTLEAMVGLL